MEGRTVNDIVAEMLEESGVYVVLETGYSGHNDVIGVAATLTGAMRLVLETEELEMWVPIKDPLDPEAGEMIPVKVDTVGAADAFQWVDENAVRGIGTFEKGKGHLRAHFQDEATRFIVQWRQMTF